MKLPGQEINGALYVGVMVDEDNRLYELYVEKEDYSKHEFTWHEAIKIKGLPSIQEMNLISANARVLGLDKNDKYYWSSTEYNNFHAWTERFSDGFQSASCKNYGYFVRCVRRVSIIQSFNHSKKKVKSELKKQTELLEKILEEITK